MKTLEFEERRGGIREGKMVRRTENGKKMSKARDKIKKVRCPGLRVERRNTGWGILAS